ncbi:hypothetical protein H4582DRAFT_825198 [Lactarius indigo]|nr:hypothetical protein H4582DRAFT_825198 [Lactarius indigo]
MAPYASFFVLFGFLIHVDEPVGFPIRQLLMLLRLWAPAGATGEYFVRRDWWIAVVGPPKTFSLFYPLPLSLRVRVAPHYTPPSFSCDDLRLPRAGRRVASKYAVITLVPLQRQRARSQHEHHDGDDPDRAHP